jgi:uroporphyrinogen-III decarboxylase
VSKQFERIARYGSAIPVFSIRCWARIAEVAAEYLALQIRAGADVVQIFDTWVRSWPRPNTNVFRGAGSVRSSRKSNRWACP